MFFNHFSRISYIKIILLWRGQAHRIAWYGVCVCVRALRYSKFTLSCLSFSGINPKSRSSVGAQVSGRHLWGNLCLTRGQGLDFPLKKGKKDLRIIVRTSISVLLQRVDWSCLQCDAVSQGDSHRTGHYFILLLFHENKIYKFKKREPSFHM